MKMTRLLMLAPTVLLFFSCTPSAIGSETGIVVDGFTIKPGQTWEITAKGGQGWEDGTSLTVGREYSTIGKTTSLLARNSGVNFISADPDYGAPVDSLVLNWKSTFPALNNADVWCVIREPKLVSVNPPTFEGRWAASFKRVSEYRRTGDLTGTGTCKVTLVVN